MKTFFSREKPIETWSDIVEMLKRLRDAESQKSAESSYTETVAKVLEYMEDALRLSTALSSPWYHPELDPEKYSPDAMGNAGYKDGGSDPVVPTSEQEELTKIEFDLTNEFGDWCFKVSKVFRDFKSIMKNELNNLKNVIKYLNEMRSQDASDQSKNFYSSQIEKFDQKGAAQGVKEGLSSSFKAFREKLNNFKMFRADHGLHRNPKYEESGLAFVFIAIICIVFETVVNGFMYGQASDLGLIGGWGVAAGLSTVIFSSSFLAGWVLTYKNGLVPVHSPPPAQTELDYIRPPQRWRRSLWLQLTGWSGWVTLTTVILILIAFVCVYRDEAAILDPGSGNHPMSEAISRVATFDLLPQADIEGLLLIFVNLAIMLIGMYKGYTCFDKVPNYKNYAKQLADARAKLKSDIEVAKSKFGLEEARFSDKLRVYDNLYVAKLVSDYLSGVEALKNLQDSCDRQIALTEEDCNNRLSAYRRANEEARRGNIESSPEYFKKPWKSPFTPPLGYEEFEELDEFRALDTGAIAGTLAEHRSEALKMLNKKAHDRYLKELSKYTSESDMDRDEVNQKER